MKIVSLSVSPGHNYFGHYGRPAGEHPLLRVEEVDCVAGRGLRGDRFFDYKDGYAGQITFFSADVHDRMRLALGLANRSAAAHRRNVTVRGVDLNALIDREFEVQGVRFQGVVECRPCLWMDQAFGPGAEAWLRGNGGLRARILTDGRLRLDPTVPAGVLLAGGRSRRMGTDKVQLPWAGTTLGEHQAALLAATGACPLWVSCRADQSWTPLGFRRAEDAGAGGPPGGLIAAWSHTRAMVMIALAVDVPEVPPEFLAELAQHAAAAGVSVVPFHDGRYEPLLAAWHVSSRPVLEEVAAQGGSLQQVCALLAARGQLSPRILAADQLGWLRNLNSRADLAELRHEAS